MPEATAETPESSAEELTRLREENARLREEAERQSEEARARERMLSQYREFSDCFPDVAPETIPEAVWERVREGIPLASAYALYARREAMRRERTADVNEKNGRYSSGRVGERGEEHFFSAAEVRGMTQTQVREHYADILESMKHWN